MLVKTLDIVLGCIQLQIKNKHSGTDTNAYHMARIKDGWFSKWFHCLTKKINFMKIYCSDEDLNICTGRLKHKVREKKYRIFNADELKV